MKLADEQYEKCGLNVVNRLDGHSSCGGSRDFLTNSKKGIDAFDAERNFAAAGKLR